MITDSGSSVNEPKENEIVFYHPWQTKRDLRKKAYPVIIKSGNLWSNGRLSNFWYWQRVSPKTGEIEETVEHGYGNFTRAIGCKVNVTRKIMIE